MPRGISVDFRLSGGGWLGMGGGPPLGAVAGGTGGGRDGRDSERGDPTGVVSSKLDSR